MAKPTEVPGLTARTPLSVAGPLLVRARLADVRRYEGGFAGDGEPDADVVHDMRVAARRLRAAMVLLGDPALAALEPEVKALQDALGALRDLQVQRTWLRDSQRTRPGAAGDLGAIADRDRPRAEKRLRRALRAWVAAVAEQVERAGSGTARRGRLGGPPVADAVEVLLARLERRMERARRKPSVGRLHRVRIAAKKLRYTMELLRSALDGADEVLEALAPLQEQLGELHDTHVRIEVLGRIVEEASPAQRGPAAKLLERVQRQRVRRESGVARELERWHRKRVAKGLRKGLR